MSTDTGCFRQELASSGVGKVGVSQTRLFGPDQDIVGQEYKTQEGKYGIELARTHGLDVEDMAGLSKEGFNGRAFIVKGKRASDSQIRGG